MTCCKFSLEIRGRLVYVYMHLLAINVFYKNRSEAQPAENAAYAANSLDASDYLEEVSSLQKICVNIVVHSVYPAAQQNHRVR